MSLVAASETPTYVGRSPRPALRPYISHFWYSDRRVAAHAREIALPTGAMTLTIRLGGDPIRIFESQDDSVGRSFRHSVLWGAQSGPVIRDSGRLGPVLGIQFRPGGASAFMRIDGLAETHTTIEALVPREELLDAKSPEEGFEILERHLVRRHEIAPAISYAIEQLSLHADSADIGELERQTNLSPKRFIQLFRETVGLTPKRFSRVRRFQSVLVASAGGAPVDWCRIALDCGYCDQAHLNRDFRLFSGICPSQYSPTSQDSPNHVAL